MTGKPCEQGQSQKGCLCKHRSHSQAHQKPYIASRGPDVPILFFDPAALHTWFALFQSGFPGLVTYAVKANDTSAVIENLHMAGLSTFDVASPAEIARVRDLCPDATLHYNNPVR